MSTCDLGNLILPRPTAIAFALQELGRKNETEKWLQKCFALDPSERVVAKLAFAKVQDKEERLARELAARRWMWELNRTRCSYAEISTSSCPFWNYAACAKT